MAMLLELIEDALDFTRVLNTSIAASWLVLAVIVLRLVLKCAPKWTRVAMWGLVAFRLLCPFSVESVLSLIPSAEVIPQEILRYGGEQRNVPAHLEVVTNPVLLQGMQTEVSESVKVELAQSVDRIQTQMVVLNLVWWCGMLGMFLYAAVSYGILLYKVQTAVCWQDNIFQSEHVQEPFVLGIVRPRIYLPFRMSEEDIPFVLAHEQTHIQRKDNWWKPLGFVLLMIHWFNPVMWLAYVLFCRDIELACDEKVIKKLGRRARADYSKALLACSSNRKMIAGCPVAFGEVGVKERVKNVLSYKRPGFLLVLATIIAGLILAVCFLTDPVTDVVEAKDVIKEDGDTKESGFMPLWNENYKDGYSDTYLSTYSVAFEKEQADCKLYIEQWYDGACMAGVPCVLPFDMTELSVRMHISMDGAYGEVAVGADKFAGESIVVLQMPDVMTGWNYETHETGVEIGMKAEDVVLAKMTFGDTGYEVVVRAVFRAGETENAGNGFNAEEQEEGQVVLDLNEVVVLEDAEKKAVYMDALEKIIYEHISPDWQQWSVTGITKFAVYDIDMDGKEELLLFHDDGSMAGMGFYVYDYNQKKGVLYQELAEFPTLKFYANGIVEAMASHNHGMAPGYVDEEFWPYTLYQYNPKTDTYDWILNVDAWEKMYNEKAWTGEHFPDKADVDGDGMLYYLMTDGEYNYDEPVDGAEYRKWRASVMGEELEMNIQFIQLPNIMPEAAG